MAVLGVGLFEVRSWLESIRYVTVKGLPSDGLAGVVRRDPSTHFSLATSAIAVLTASGARR